MNTAAHQLRSIAARYQRPLDPPSVIPQSDRSSPRIGLAAKGLGLTAPTGDRAAMTGRTRRNRLEAVLLMAREPLTLRKLAQSANLADGTEVRTLLTELRECYDARGSAFQVEHLAGGYQLMTRPKFATWLRPLVPREQDVRLSPPALETLAVVAYRQPILRAEVEAIRGVACGEILRQLMDRDLLRIVGRSEELGRPLWYGTTKRFLQAFGLRDLNQLPLAASLRRRAADDSAAEATAAASPNSQATGAADAA